MTQSLRFWSPLRSDLVREGKNKGTMDPAVEKMEIVLQSTSKSASPKKPGLKNSLVLERRQNVWAA